MDDFDEYVTGAWPRLLRSAWLLTGDWHKAEDLVQTVLARIRAVAPNSRGCAGRAPASDAGHDIFELVAPEVAG